MKTSTFGNGELPYEIVSVSEAYARPLDQKSNQLRYMVVADQKHTKKDLLLFGEDQTADRKCYLIGRSQISA